jgi:hypothetical protein
MCFMSKTLCPMQADPYGHLLDGLVHPLDVLAPPDVTHLRFLM